MRLTIGSASLFLCLSPSYAFDLKQVEIPVQLGFFESNPGQAEHINIQGLIGNQYTITSNQTESALIGTGLFIPGLDTDLFKLSYGINGFYFGKTSVYGNIIQENVFTNLSYQYTIQHVPVYLAAKAKIKTSSEKYKVILDAGLGPNWMNVSHYNETSLDGITLPDNIFSSHSTVVFSATAGVGLRVNNVFGTIPLECGYRFFYLGQGHLNSRTNQVLNTLSTGENYANALICSVTV